MTADTDEFKPGDRATWMRVLLTDRKGGDMTEWPEELRVRKVPQ